MTVTATASTGLNVAGQFGFNAADYIPQSVQDDATTVAGYYAQVSSITDGLSTGPGGRITLSPAASQAATQAILGGMALAGPEGAALAAVTATILALGPKAGSGQGVCVTSPPPGPALDQLQSWPYFSSWADRNGSYPAPVPGSFEAFANPLLEYNWLLWNNCYDFQTPPPTLLALLIASWNSKHAAIPQRIVTRSGLNPVGFNPEGQSYDPIANALEMAYLAKYTPADQTFEQAAAGVSAPNNISSSFSINNGGLLLQPLTLKLTLKPQSQSQTAMFHSPAAKTVAGVTAAAVGTVSLTAIAWSLATGKAWDWAFAQAWAEMKDVFAAGGPHKFLTESRKRNPISGAEERSGSATQTLLFSRRKYTPSSAKAWARAHGYRSGKVDVTSNYIRLRQTDPGKFRRLRTVTFSKDIKAVVGFK